MATNPNTGQPYEPRRWQREAIPAIGDALRGGHKPIVIAATGCHEASAEVMMHDGTTKRADEVRVGDALMGPDSTPRFVRSLCRGNGKMYKIVPVKGDAWIVNEDHILSLVHTSKKRAGEIRDVSVAEWLGWTKTERHLWKLFRVGVDFRCGHRLPVPAYFLGIMLGDGSTASGVLNITTMDDEIGEAFRQYCEASGYNVRKYTKPGNAAYSLCASAASGSPNAGQGHGSARVSSEDAQAIRMLYAAGGTRRSVARTMGVSASVVEGITIGKTYTARPSPRPIHDALDKLGLLGKTSGEKFVPHQYKTGSTSTRSQVLAGLLDTDGSHSNGGYDYISKSKQLSDDVAWLARSLGLAAYVKQCRKGCQTGSVGTYYRVSISGECSSIPVRLDRKKAAPRKQIKDVLRTGFKVEEVGAGDYYGWSLTGDRRYLMSDFTVTHNSGKSVALTEVIRLTESVMPRGECIVVTTPTQDLVKQLSKTIAARIGDRAVGVYYGARKQPGRRVIVACNPSLTGLIVDLAARGRVVRLWIADECHRTEAPGFMAALPELAPRFRIGFTATPFRSADDESLSMFDSIAYRYDIMQALRDGVLVPWQFVHLRDEDLADNPTTNQACMRMIREHTEGPGVVSANGIKDAEEYASELTAEGIPAAAVHSKLKPAEVAGRLEDLRLGRLRCVVHVALLVEGVDLPWLRWLCFRRPRSADIAAIQEIGRGLRTHPGKTECVVLDPHYMFGDANRIRGRVAVGGEALDLDAMMADQLDEEREKKERLADQRAELPPPKAVAATMSWAQSALWELRLAGVIPDDVIQSTGWRTLPARDRQIASLQKMGAAWRRYLPEQLKAPMDYLCKPDVARQLQRGAVSDLLSILHGVASKAPPGNWEDRKGWAMEWPEGLVLPELEPAALRGMRRAAGPIGKSGKRKLIP